MLWAPGDPRDPTKGPQGPIIKGEPRSSLGGTPLNPRSDSVLFETFKLANFHNLNTFKPSNVQTFKLPKFEHVANRSLKTVSKFESLEV